jgi:hypothetical protein
VITARETWLVLVVVERVGTKTLYFYGESANYGSKYKGVQEMKARKAGGKGQPSEEVANNPSSINLVDASRNFLARYLCDEGYISPDYDYWPSHGNGPDSIND